MGFRAFFLSLIVAAITIGLAAFILLAIEESEARTATVWVTLAGGFMIGGFLAWRLDKLVKADAGRDQDRRTLEAQEIYTSLSKGHGRDYVLYLTDSDATEVIVENPDWSAAEADLSEPGVGDVLKTAASYREPRALTPGSLLCRWMSLPVIQLGGREAGPGVVACSPRNQSTRLKRLIDHANSIFLLATEPYATDRALAALKGADRLSSTVILVPGTRALKRTKVNAHDLRAAVSRYRRCPELFSGKILALWEEESVDGEKVVASELNEQSLRRLDIDGIPWPIIQQVRASETSHGSVAPGPR